MGISLLTFALRPAFRGGTIVNFNFQNSDLFPNLIRGINWSGSATGIGAFIDANQLPQGNIALGTLQSVCQMPGGYDDFVAKYTGNASFGISAVPLIFYNISPSGAVAGIAGTSGVSGGNTAFNLASTDPRGQFAFGDLITGTSSNGALQQFALSTTGFGNVSFAAGAAFAISSISGSGSVATVSTVAPHGLPIGLVIQGVTVTGASPSSFNGSNLTITVTGASSFTYSNTTSGSATLPGSYTVGAATLRFRNISGLASTVDVVCYRATSSAIVLVGVAAGTYTPIMTGGPGSQSEVRYSQSQITATLNTGAGSISWSSVVLCLATNESLMASSNQIGQAVIDSLVAIKAKYIRFMDATAVINSTQANFIGRQPKTAQSFTGNRIEPSYWGGSFSWSSGDQYTATNPSNSPSGGAYLEGEMVQGYSATAATTNTPSLQLGSRGYKPIFGITCTPFTIRLGGTITNGDTISITFTGSQIVGSPLTKTYTVNSAVDTSIDRLGANFTAFLGADTALQAANFQFGNAGSGHCSLTYSRAAGGGVGGTINGVSIGGGTSFSYSTSGGSTETVTLGTADTYTTNGNTAFISTTTAFVYTFNKILDGWIVNTGMGGIPYEICAEACNRTGAGYWANIPLLYTTDAAQAYGALLADPSVLNANTPIVVELSNEVWNFGQFQTTMAGNLSNGLGFSGVTYADFYALRFIQLLAQAFVNGYVGAGGNRTNLKLTIADTMLEGNGGYSGVMQSHRWNGAALNTSNPIYASLGGPNCTSTSTNYDTAPNRPIDLANGTSYAMYFKGALIKNGASDSFTGGSGQQSFYNSFFQASADYATGIPTSVTAALNVWNQDIISGTRNGILGNATLASFLNPGNPVPGWQAKISSYDVQRAGFSAPAISDPIDVYMYEAGLEESLGASSVNGLHTPDPTATIAAFSAQGYTLFPTYGASNAEVAQNMVNLSLAYKNSQQCHDMVKNNYCQSVYDAHPGRKVYPAWYGYANQNVWGFYPGNISTMPYQTWNGFRDFTP